MELRVLDEGTPGLVAVVGRLDIKGVGEVDTKFFAVVTAPRKPMIVDMSEVEFIGSLGIGMLAGAARALQRSGAGMVLLDPQNFVKNVLEAAHIPDVIP